MYACSGYVCTYMHLIHKQYTYAYAYRVLANIFSKTIRITATTIIMGTTTDTAMVAPEPRNFNAIVYLTLDMVKRNLLFPPPSLLLVLPVPAITT